jgi:hypothetical protein
LKKGDRGGFAFDSCKSKSKSPLPPFFKGGKALPLFKGGNALPLLEGEKR